MTKLIHSRNNVLIDSNRQDVSLWQNITGNLIGTNVVLIDRCDEIILPYNFKNIFPMLSLNHAFNKSYEEVCISRAEQLIKLSKTTNKPIVIMYSGGIDSTLVVIAFMLAANGDYTNIQIALSSPSIRENPKFYYDHIRSNFKLLPSEKSLYFLNGDYIVVGGEGNDQLMGSDYYKQLYVSGNIDLLNVPYTESLICDMLINSGMTSASAKQWFYLLDLQIRKTQVCQISTVKDFFWWLNFSFKWQAVYFRMIVRSNYFELINQQFLDLHYHQFFMTDDFQQWSILNPDKKIGNTWASYKLESKKLILEFTKDREYFDYKTKVGSLQALFRHRTVPDALDENYQLIQNINKEDFYLEDNSFKQ